MMPWQMSMWQLESILDVPRNLRLKFHQNRVSNSWDIGDIEFVWGGVQSHFRVKPNRCVEVRLGFWQKLGNHHQNPSASIEFYRKPGFQDLALPKPNQWVVRIMVLVLISKPFGESWSVSVLMSSKFWILNEFLSRHPVNFLASMSIGFNIIHRTCCIWSMVRNYCMSSYFIGPVCILWICSQLYCYVYFW